MIFQAVRELKHTGVLGMNRRNAEYVLQHNPRSSYPFADDKVLTKRLAPEFGIPTPRLYQVLERHGEIHDFEKRLNGQREFVVKPARGGGGSGIVLISGSNEKGFFNQNDELITRDELRYHISSIVSGIFSLEGLEDRAMFEELIRPDAVFCAITYLGVPDIRIIVYRGVPVMGMLRLPTRASDGKANLHRGAIGAGIDILSGETLSAVHRSQVITHHPDTGNPVNGIRVPYWQEMLLMAARTYDMTGLGYLGMDMIIDREKGPLLLEANARPGLAIQLANRAGLRKRLEAVEKAPPEIFSAPETRVAWALEAF